MFSRRGFFASLLGIHVPREGSKKAHCRLYWVDDDNKIWGLTIRGEVILVHHHASKIKSLAARGA